MLKIRLFLVIAITLYFTGFINTTLGGAVEDQQSSQKQFLITIDISDGSRVVGAPSGSAVTLNTSFAKLDIPWADIQSIKLKDDKETVIVKFQNGDSLTGALPLKSLELKTIFGEVSVGIKQVKKISIHRSGIFSREGLVVYYPFNGNANDESVNGNHGTVHGASLTKDRFGNENSAYYFDGVDDYLICKNNTSLNPSKAITLSAWVFPKKIVSGETGIVQKWKAGGANVYSYSIELRSGIPEFALSPAGGSGGGFSYGVVTTQKSLPVNNWTYLTAVYDGSYMYLYIDGIKTAKNAYNKDIYNSPIDLLIGRSSWSKTFEGIIDEVKIYDRALSESEVREFYDIGK